MNNEIRKYISKYVDVTNDIETALEEAVFIKCFDKGTILLREGAYSNECYFILKGCIRSYYIKNGDEKTIEFYTEEQSITPSSYGTSTPSEYYLECNEDTMAAVGTPEIEREMCVKFPQLEVLNRKIAEVIMAKQQDALADFKMNSPEQRYWNLVKNRPNLLQRVPQYQIASYLGITPESLSRIRKRSLSK
jgi:CRP-like cAMP-binding protein